MKSFTGALQGLAAGLLGLASLLVGCATSRGLEASATHMGIEPREAITILLHGFSGKSVAELEPKEQEIVRCVSKPIRDAHPHLRIIPPHEFRRAAFPDLAPEEVPTSPDSLASLRENDVFRGRIAPLGLRYLISIDGGTEQSWKTVLAECGAAPGGGACFILRVADRHSRLVASILDLSDKRATEGIQVSASGHPWWAIVGIFPIGLPSFTESSACEDLGESLAQSLARSRLPEP